MSDVSKIEWTDATWNPVTGCTKVSQGCKHCYAERDWQRLSANPKTIYYGRDFTDVRCHLDRIEQPLRWRKPRRIFVNSMSDLFHDLVPDGFIADVFATIAATPWHTYQVLTKRPQRMRDVLCHSTFQDTIEESMALITHSDLVWPIPNLWLGVSVEDQATADERIPLLLQTPAAVRWISAEPVLGTINLARINLPEDTGEDFGGWKEHGFDGIAQWLDALTGRGYSAERTGDVLVGAEHGYTENHLNWIVTGGESGPKARLAHPDWFRSLRDQCAGAGVPFFFKQWGEWAPPIGEGDIPPDALEGRMYRVGKRAAGRLLDGRVHDEYPS